MPLFLLFSVHSNFAQDGVHSLCQTMTSFDKRLTTRAMLMPPDKHAYLFSVYTSPFLPSLSYTKINSIIVSAHAFSESLASCRQETNNSGGRLIQWENTAQQTFYQSKRTVQYQSTATALLEPRHHR
ncbi:hypothetical protein T12_10579 [Trichinella patagoniensis]|uniref:Uncharacterized protein n=1 Tax=Trichinella patagoniensis TaxID=990121 RepID=A0A0V0Z2K8_9BILA|nr:hypothetical protein T12_10579 [Trichinella patagoniensis]